MANKYQKFSKAAKLHKVVRRRVVSFDPVDDLLNEDHKETVEQRVHRASEAFAVARKMFVLLAESNLDHKSRGTALQLLTVLHNRLGND